MALTSEGKLYGWGWNKFGQVGVGNNDDHCSPVQVHFPEEQKISQVACGWRHTLALSEKKNVFSWGRGTSGQLGNGEIVDRNTPVLIDALSPDGSGCKKLESSTAAPFTAKVWVSPSERYAIVPDENVPKSGEGTARGNGADANVPENDVKRMRVQS